MKHAQRRRFTVNWYGDQPRRGELATDAGHWHKAGGGLARSRWVLVRDLDGTHREGDFYSRAASLPPERIVSLFAGRWSIEVISQEVRTHFRFTTPPYWSRKSVLRTGQCVLGMYSLVSLIDVRALGERSATPLRTP